MASAYSLFITSLKQFKCPETRFNSTSCEEMLLRFRKGLRAKGPSSNFHSFDYLNELLSPYEVHNCHVMVTNFRHVNLESTRCPIVIRHPDIAVSWENHSKFWNFELTWIFSRSLASDVAFNSNKTIGINADSNLTRKCDESKFWAGIVFTGLAYRHNLHDSCILLKIKSYTINSKPWTCQIDIGLYPIRPPGSGASAYGKLNYPKVFRLPDERLGIYFNIVPSPVPPIHIYVSHESIEKVTQMDLNWWMKTISINHHKKHMKRIAHDMFFLFSVGNSSKLNPYLNIFLVHVCSNCGYGSPLIYTKLQISKLLFRNFIKNTGESKHQHHVWKVEPNGHNEFYDNVIVNLRSCDNLHLTSLKQIFLGNKSRSQQVEYAYASIWTSIMGNYTYHSIHNRTCVNGKLKPTGRLSDSEIVKITLGSKQHFQYNTGGQLYAVDLSNLVDRLKFVSCGQRGFGDLPYKELLRVFDNNVWAMILVVIFALACSISGVLCGGMGLIVHMIFTCIKVFLEQGTPVVEKYTKNIQLRFILGPFLLLAMVISNGYKNTNMYRMITSRDPISYDKLSELVQDNFSIYVGASATTFSFQGRQDKVMPRISVKSHKIQINNMEMVAQGKVNSQVSGLTPILRSSDPTSPTLKVSSSTSVEKRNVFINQLQIHTSLHPLLPVALQAAISNLTAEYHANFEFSLAFSRDMHIKLSNFLKQGESKLFIDSLQNCNRTAVIVPENTGQLFANELKDAGHRHVFMGKEIYSTRVGISFNLTGLIPRLIIERIKGIEASGVWKWLATFSQVKGISNGATSGESTPKPATMRGNILVVFFPLFCGTVISVTFFLLEFLQKIFSHVTCNCWFA